jgi:hypothetical protein
VLQASPIDPGPQLAHPRLETFPHDLFEVSVQVEAFGNGKVGQLQGLLFKREAAALRHGEGILHRLRIRREALGHLRPTLQVVVRRVRHAALALDGGPRLNADQRIVGRVVLRQQIVTVVGGHQSDPQLGGQTRHALVHQPLFGEAVVLHL